MKNVLITGVDKGIGKALLEKFAREDFFVIGTCLGIDSGDKIKEELSKENNFSDNLKIFQMDLSETKSIENCVSEIKKFLTENDKKINILINNAGVMLDRNQTNLDILNLRKSLEINLIGPADFTERFLQDFDGEGHILNISSIAGSFAHVDSGTGRAPNFYPAYRISKTALNMHTNILAERLKEKNIIVSAVHPGLTKTDMGGPEGVFSPKETAENIFKFAISKPETGNFWFNGQKIAW
jgi:NAD(P)-dependent dehydrogenase (short-subunit alcohol dehydrogenase family)